jgi:hypothetical protein
VKALSIWAGVQCPWGTIGTSTSSQMMTGVSIRGAENLGKSDLLCLRSFWFVLWLFILFKGHFDVTSSFRLENKSADFDGIIDLFLSIPIHCSIKTIHFSLFIKRTIKNQKGQLTDRSLQSQCFFRIWWLILIICDSECCPTASF